MGTIEVQHTHRDRFLIRIRGHELVVDQPVDAGGDDLGPTPTELFVAGLAACAGFYAERFLARHGLPTTGLAVTSEYRISEDAPVRVTDVTLRVTLPEGFPPERRVALGRVMDRCLVKNSLARPPDVTTVMEPAPRAA